ncbi:TPA: phage tail protein, partial [Escherichia coli]
ATQEELAHIVESAGLALDINDMTQVLKAIQKLTLSRANPFADIKSDGAAAISTALTNLGLGEGSALPVGVPVPWPSATPPTGWLKCNGAAFSAEEYPELAKAYPTNKLPDLRGEFIRGWDDGRNVDAGRALLSQQGDAMQKISGTVADNAMGVSASGSGAMTITGASGTTYYASSAASSSYIYYKTIGIDSSLVARTANENRPRNIAFNYIVRAA